MTETTFKIKLEMSWEFIVFAENEELAIEKTIKHLKKLFLEDGFSVWASKAEEDILNKNYEINTYDGFVVS